MTHFDSIHCPEVGTTRTSRNPAFRLRCFTDGGKFKFKYYPMSKISEVLNIRISHVDFIDRKLYINAFVFMALLPSNSTYLQIKLYLPNYRLKRELFILINNLITKFVYYNFH